LHGRRGVEAEVLESAVGVYRIGGDVPEHDRRVGADQLEEGASLLVRCPEGKPLDPRWGFCRAGLHRICRVIADTEIYAHRPGAVPRRIGEFGPVPFPLERVGGQLHPLGRGRVEDR
jgi:hypothetical protein